MSYQRVIPRDLFNEASLLKCLGQLWLKLEGGALPALLTFDGEEEGIAEAFDIRQDDSDGAIWVANVRLRVRGAVWRLRRPLNSREPWPLWVHGTILAGGDFEPFEPFEVFDRTGELSAEFVAAVCMR